MTFLKISLLLFILPFSLFCREIQTFYGPLIVEEPVLLELIDSPAFQRLKSIHQYGVAYYTTHREEYNRYDHSLGVFTILRKKGACLEEQIAGLLHDVSHTVFSHVGDWIFNKENQEEDYQNSIHLSYLQNSGLAEILLRHGFDPAQLLPREENFPALEQKKPNLCADRIDYNIQGAFYQNFITQNEGVEILDDLTFSNGKWVSSKMKLMEKLVKYSLFMTQDCWSSATNFLSSRWLADAILRAIDIGELNMDEIHFGTDPLVWNKLLESQDSIVQHKMQMVQGATQLYELVEAKDAEYILKARFLGIDPWISYEGKLHRLTHLKPDLADEFNVVKEKMGNGWPIILKKNANFGIPKFALKLT